MQASCGASHHFARRRKRTNSGLDPSTRCLRRLKIRCVRRVRARPCCGAIHVVGLSLPSHGAQRPLGDGVVSGYSSPRVARTHTRLSSVCCEAFGETSSRAMVVHAVQRFAFSVRQLDFRDLCIVFSWSDTVPLGLSRDGGVYIGVIPLAPRRWHPREGIAHWVRSRVGSVAQKGGIASFFWGLQREFCT